MLIMMCCMAKWESIEQLPWKFAVGAPNWVVSGFASPLAIVAGIEPRGQNQILMKFEVHSIAYTPTYPLAKNIELMKLNSPPPLSLNGFP
jgi:hypothetical protein